MCGICGIARLRADAASPAVADLRRMRDAMAARGPDGEGEWLDPDGRLALGHRRLAILDLSEAGAQPMATPDGRYRIVYNGEIYNFRELRASLERDGVALRSESDTEVILALWAREGAGALARLRGMYAFALWDGLERELTLVRDPFGIKPLYYEVRPPGELRFASQVRALEAGGASRAVDPAALAGFLLWGSVPEPRTIRASVRALPAGHLLCVRDGAVGEPRPLPAAGAAPESEAGEALAASVSAHLVSDVPIALFLSAGLDSALVATLAAGQLGERLSTFTLTFEGWQGSERDEGPLAREVAAALGTRHLERRLSRADVAAAWQPALAAMDQPSIDGFNTFLVARAAHEAGIKVALSGLGGDELFGGYPSFRDLPRWSARARLLRKVPAASRIAPALARALFPSKPKLQGLTRYGKTLAGSYFLRRGLFLPEELSSILGPELAREALAGHEPVAEAEAAAERPTLFDAPEPKGGEPGRLDSWLAAQRLEATLYLRNQLLRDSDWAAMASSVELRVPLVDVPLWKSLRTRNFEPARSRGKAALVREVANRLAPALPEALWRRPKSGFSVPVAEWMVPARPGERESAGGGSRRLALRLIEELGLCAR